MPELTDKQKSALLAKAMGLDVAKVVTNPVQVLFGHQEREYCEVIYYRTNGGKYISDTEDFYTDHMEVAWMVLNWACTLPSPVMWKAPGGVSYQMARWLMDNIWRIIREGSVAEAQRAILDAIFDLAVQNGVIEVGE